MSGSFGGMTCRFVDGLGATRLDINNTGTDPASKTGGGGWYIARGGLDIGTKALERAWIGQVPYGTMLAATMAPPVEMHLKLLMVPQVSATTMKALYDALVVELRRKTNIIELKPEGVSTSYFIDTFRADEPSMFRPIEVPNVFKLLQLGQPIEFTMFREPELRGAGVMV